MRWNTSSLYDPDPAPAGGGGSTLTQQEIERVRLALSRPNPPPQAAAPAGPQPQGPSKKELETAFWNDPLGMSAAIATQAANMARQSSGGIDTLIEVARGEARKDDPEVFDRYEQEIRFQLQSVDPQFHQNVTVWKNAFNMVRGAHSKEIYEMRKAAPATPSGSDGPAVPRPASAPPAPKTKLSEDQKYVAKKLGVTEEQYTHGSKIIEEQHGREASPWDAVITTEGRKVPHGRRAA